LGKSTSIKIDKILDKLPVDFSPYSNPDICPDIRTLRRYIRKEKLKDPIIEITLIPILSKLEEPFKDFFGGLFKELWIRKLDLEIVFKFIDEISSQIKHKKTKRDLMRKLRINKKHCDLILKWAKDRDLIKLKEYPQGTVWITYIG